MSARSYRLPGVRLLTGAAAEDGAKSLAHTTVRRSADQTSDDHIEQAIIGALVLAGSVFALAAVREIF